MVICRTSLFFVRWRKSLALWGNDSSAVLAITNSSRALHLAGIDNVVPTRYQQINLSTFNSCSRATSMAVSLYLAVSLSTEELPQEIRMPEGNEDWDRAFPPWRHPLFGHFLNPQ
jgi:hypothetical protein